MIRSIVLCASLALALTAGPASAQQRAVPEGRAQVQLSLAPVVKQAAPAVVNVYGTRVEKQQQNPFFDDPFFRRFFGGDFGVPQERVQRSLGSGVIVDPSGLVVTNNHVIENMTEVKVALADRREFEAEIVLRDPRTDLAVLRLKNKGPFPALLLGDSDALEVGDFVIAIGNPFGVGQTVTQGIVSALARTQVGITDYQSFIQTDAAINPGNSGGALVDMHGRVVGINTAIFSRSGGSHGIGFAIPASMVRVVVDSARNGGRSVRRPWFGARLQVVSNDIAESIGLDRPAGALVAAIDDRSPAAQGGLLRGDVIVAVDGQPVDDPEGFGYRFATKPLGGTASLTVLRGGKKVVVPVRLEPAPETRPREAVKITGRSPLAGATAANMSPAVAEELSMDPVSEGVVITDVQEGSAAAQVGFQKGDMILAVNGERIGTSRALEKALRERSRLWELTISRKGQVFTTVLGG
ncbi:DegQ family serine endoprotease [Chelatococcus sp. SYSU_G07232]|uniref:DegQ family serine endoprotease n=1 Tax=Chelatococcus albus TaxID=3047466 RepID=A0ABT7AD18_9HYPH|nr:DegQ family serine endoprotease [Chelatococcus sp. SYSU_G07232]MDJ1157272.1 DegQ family serine endoprotease [Chelatococcus sp. SYSU_G07232]